MMSKDEEDISDGDGGVNDDHESSKTAVEMLQ